MTGTERITFAEEKPNEALRVLGYCNVDWHKISLVYQDGWGILIINSNNYVKFHKAEEDTIPSAFELGDMLIERCS